MLTHSGSKSALNTGIGGYTRCEDCLLGPFTLKTTEMTYPARITAKPKRNGTCEILLDE